MNESTIAVDSVKTEIGETENEATEVSEEAERAKKDASG